MRTKDRIAIGWLDPGQVDGMFAISVANVFAERHERVSALLRVEAGGLLSRGRNELVAQFMEQTDCEWLLMLDSDERLDLDAFDKLVGAVHDKDRPIVAGLYFGAWPGDYYPTAMPLIFNSVPDSTTFVPFIDYPTDTLVEVDSAGTGCLMIHRTVFEAFQAEATAHEGKNWCWFRDMPVNGDWFSEDHFFCARAKELGYSIWAHTGATLAHRKRFWLTERHHRPMTEEFIKEALKRARRDGDEVEYRRLLAAMQALNETEKALPPKDAEKRA